MLVAVSALLTGCVPLFGADPHFVTDSAARPHGEGSPAPAPAETPRIAAPKHDLSWSDCTAKGFTDAGVPGIPGVKLECATYDNDLDPIAGGSSGTITIGVMRARSGQTPSTAGPLVFTTGSDIPSSIQLPVWLSRAGTDVLASHPIVAVDRRGIGQSSPIECRESGDRLEMREQAQFEFGDDPVAILSDVANTVTTSCTDAIGSANTAYDNTHASLDLERLRTLWDVPTLAIAGVGNGAQIALTYAASRPDKVARLALDSPIAFGVAAEAAAEQQVRGQQAALNAFAAQCLAVRCSLGADPKAAVAAIIDDARAGRGVSGLALSAVVDALTVALGFPTGDRVAATTTLSDTLAAARAGNTAGLIDLVNRANALLGTDGQFVNACSDALIRPTPDRIRELVVSWGKLYPQFGTVAALQLTRCVHWPTGTPVPPPKKLDLEVLLLGVQNDAITGSEGVAATAATIINAGSASKRVMWQGIGHGASVYSPCTTAPLTAYLDTGKLPDTDVFCPA